ncbi:hypothetical protein [Herbaspirillum robiniae]|uniref:hypothetical protein n=1 Tax=Herbaspirillum robiniae TaxID=2014887 RepID=UPI003D7707AD
MYRRITFIFFTSISFFLWEAAFSHAEGVNSVYGQAAEDTDEQAVVEQKAIEERRGEFLAHLQNARNITLVRSDSAFSWRIDWKAQREFCRKVVNALFRDKSHLKFPSPIFVSTLGSQAQLQQAVNRVLPTTECSRAVVDALDFNNKLVPSGSSMGSAFEPWGLSGYSLRLYSTYENEKVFFVAEYINPRADYTVGDVNGLWGAIPSSPVMARGFYLPAGASKQSNGISRSCQPRGNLEAVGYPSSRSNMQKVVIGKIDERLMTFEFGTYSERRFPGYERMDVLQSSRSGPLWGRIGQQYVLVKDIEMSFVGSWALSRPGGSFAGDNQVMDAHTKDDAYSYACVINFDKSNR